MSGCKAWRYDANGRWFGGAPPQGVPVHYCGQPDGHPGNHVALIGHSYAVTESVPHLKLKQDDKVEVLVRGVVDRLAGMADTWRTATVCTTDVYKSMGTVFTVLYDGTENEYMSLKYADEGKTWRRIPAVDVTVYRRALSVIADRLGISPDDPDSVATCTIAELDELARLHKAKKENKLAKKEDASAATVLATVRGALGFDFPHDGNVAEEVARIRMLLRTTQNDLAQSRAVVNRIAVVLGLGQWAADGQDFVDRIGKFQAFGAWLKRQHAYSVAERDKWEYDRPERKDWKLVVNQLEGILNEWNKPAPHERPPAEVPSTLERTPQHVGGDDEERIACPKAGELMHQCCGWCLEHKRPKFECPLDCKGARTISKGPRCHVSTAMDCNAPVTHAEHFHGYIRFWCDKHVPMSGHYESCPDPCRSLVGQYASKTDPMPTNLAEAFRRITQEVGCDYNYQRPGAMADFVIQCIKDLRAKAKQGT